MFEYLKLSCACGLQKHLKETCFLIQFYANRHPLSLFIVWLSESKLSCQWPIPQLFKFIEDMFNMQAIYKGCQKLILTKMCLNYITVHLSTLKSNYCSVKTYQLQTQWTINNLNICTDFVWKNSLSKFNYQLNLINNYPNLTFMLYRSKTIACTHFEFLFFFAP